MRNNWFRKVLVAGIIFLLMWTSTVPVTEAAGSSIAIGKLRDYISERKLARTSDGNLHCVYFRLEGSYHRIYYSYSTDEGLTWTEEPSLTSATQDCRHPCIAVDQDDNIHVAWSLWHGSAGPGWYATVQYRVKTSTWQGVEDVITGYHDCPSLAIDSQGVVHLAVGGFGGGSWHCARVQYLYKSTLSSDWSTPYPVSSSCWATVPELVVDEDDNIHVLYVHAPKYGPYYGLRYRKKVGGVWQGEEIVQEDDGLWSCGSMALDSNGIVYVVWCKLDTGWIRIRQRTSGGWQTTGDVFLPDGYSQRTPVVSIDKNNYINVVWSGKHEGSPDYYQIRYRKYTNSWGSVQGITSASVDQENPHNIWAWHPEVNGARTNRPKNGYAFVWNDGDMIKFYKSADLAWESPSGSEIAEGNLGLRSPTRKVARTSDGVLHCVYHRSDGLHSQIYHSYSGDDGETWNEEALTSASYDQTEPTVAVDSNDYLHVLWQGCHSGSPSHPQIRYKKYTTTGWGDIIDITTDTGWDQRTPAIAVDSNDNLHVVWQKIDVICGPWCGGGCGPTYYSKYTSSWSTPVRIGEGYQYREMDPSIVIDSNDYLHVAWTADGYHAASCYHSAYRRFTTSWQPIESFVCYACWPSIAVDSQGNVHLVSNYGYPSNQIIYRKRTAGGWENSEDITPAGSENRIASIAIDSNDYVHVVWSEDGKIKYRKKTSSWQETETIISDTDSISPKLFGAYYPEVDGVKTNRPKNGYAFVWNDGSMIKFYKSADLEWETPSGNQLPECEWMKTYGGSDYDNGFSVQQTSDGGYVITGSTYSYGNGLRDVWLIKTDSNGNEEWNMTFGGANNDIGHYVQQTIDGGYIITGYTESYGPLYANAWLIKTDSNGNEEWNKTFGSIRFETGYSVQQTSDGGFIITGFYQEGWTGTNVWLIKTDSNGTTEWSRGFGGRDTGDMGYCVQQTDDGGYIIVGEGQTYGAGQYDLWLIKTDSNGNWMWDKSFGGKYSDEGRSVQQTSDGGYIVAGKLLLKNAYGYYIADVYLIKTNSSGGEEWSKNYGGNDYDYGYSVQQTSDGGYIITGSTHSYGKGGHDVWLIKTDTDGNEKWNITIGGTSRDVGRSVQQTNDGGYIITGHTYSYGSGLSDVCLIKVTGENQPLICTIELQKDSVPIDEINVGEFFDIYVGDSTDDGIVEVRFSSDESQDGIPTGEWKGWYDWNIPDDPWHANDKIMRWSFDTGGPKEVWAEVNDTYGQTNKSSADIYVNFYFVHISDTHVKHYKDQENSKEKWESIIENITSFDPSPEFVIVSGDLVDFGAGLMGADNYITFRSYLHGSRPNWYLDLEQKIPVYFCPGNHDYREWHPVFRSKWFGDFSLENYQNYIRQPNEDSYRILDPNTNTFIVSLNSGHDKILKGTYFPPRGTGFLPEQMNWLENELDNLDGDLNNDCDTSGYKKIIFMHHPVIYYRENDDWKHWGGHIEGGIWDAGCILNKKTRFLNICDQYGVDVVLSGHTHTNRVYDRDMDGSSFPGDQNGYNNEPFDIAYFPLSTLYKKPLYVITGSNLDGDYRMIQCKSNELLVWKENTIIDIVTSKIIGCPVELHLYDSNGNHVGRNNTGGVDFEIENATYSFNPLEFTEETDPTKWNHTIEEISLPYGFDNYRYQLKGTGEGVFNFSIRKRLNDGSDLIIFYENISITDTSMGKLYVYEDSVDYTIYMDDDGDGIVDREIQPDEVICAEVPYPPSTPSGPTKGFTDFSYSYSTNTSDPEDDEIYYLFEWGEGTDSGWLGPYTSGEPCTASHTWTNSGTYYVRTRVKDVDDHISDWSSPLKIEIYDFEATIDIDPDTLNLNSTGKWISCYIELPNGYNISNISIDTILLNDIINAEITPLNISDYDNDGISDLMVKFDRQAVQDILELGDDVEIKISGELIDGTKFEGVDYIRVI